MEGSPGFWSECQAYAFVLVILGNKNGDPFSSTSGRARKPYIAHACFHSVTSAKAELVGGCLQS